MKKNWSISIAVFMIIMIISMIILPNELMAQNISIKSTKATPSSEYSPNTAHDLGYTGKGVTIAIIDTGIDNEHPTFKDAFVAGVDFTVPESIIYPRDGTVDPDDLDGHGTAVASVALGRGDNNGDFIGMAPNAGLVDLKIQVGEIGSATRITEAINWCINHKDKDWGNGYVGIDVISISDGLGEAEDSVAPAVQNAVSQGIVVVSAADDTGTSDEDNLHELWYMVDEAIIVGGTDIQDTVDRSDDIYWSRSTWGPRVDDSDQDYYDELKPDVSAPAANISVASYSPTSDITPATGYDILSSNSYSTPHVSGLVALMIEANHEIKPTKDKNTIKLILHSVSEQRGEIYNEKLSEKFNIHFGWGMIDAYAAVEYARDYVDSETTPVITEFSINPSRVKIGDVCILSGLAMDREEQKLSYDVTINDGKIANGSSPRTWEWTAPDKEGTYSFTLKVIDSTGREDSAELDVEVVSNESNVAPQILSIEATDTIVAPGGSTEIITEAYDIDGNELYYDYFTDKGTISGDGNRVTYTAPDTVGTATINATVTDPFGESDSASLIITIREDVIGEPTSIDFVKLTPDRIKQGDEVTILIEVKVEITDFEIMSVQADLTSLGIKKRLAMVDDGSGPDRIAGDFVYSLSFEIMDILEGTYEISVSVLDSTGFEVERSETIIVNAPVEILEEQNQTNHSSTIKGIGITTFILLLFCTLFYLVIRMIGRDKEKDD